MFAGWNIGVNILGLNLVHWKSTRAENIILYITALK
jgi:hypothetical protein